MFFTTWIAFRYLKSRKLGRYAPLLTFTSIASVAAGMLALVLVMSVMRGFRTELADRLLGFNSHITLTSGENAKTLSREEVAGFFDPKDLASVWPFVQGEVVAQSRTMNEPLAQGARVRGVWPDELATMRSVDFYFPEGTGFDAILRGRGTGGLPGAVVGNDIVSQLSVHPDFEDRIELTAPLAEVMPSGEMGPNRMAFKVAGVFKAGVFDCDSKYIFTSLDEAKRLLGLQATEGWHVRLTDAGDVEGALASIGKKLPEGWKAEGWNEQNRKLFAALRLERIAMGGVLTMVLLIASFAIAGVVMLTTASKQKDIAILESVGMTRRGISRIFLLHAAFIGAFGSAAGLIGGLVIATAIQRWPIKLPPSYYLDWLPVEINFTAAFAFAAGGVLIAVLAAIYPVRQALGLNPVEVLRYE